MREALWSGPGDELPEDRESIAHTASGTARNQREGCGVGRHPLGLAHRGEVLLKDPGGDEPEGVVEGARSDRGNDLVGLGSREDEAHVLRRLLHELEQRIEPRVGDHVGLVNDVDLVAGRDRGKHRTLAQLAGVFDSPMARCIEFDDVDGAGAVGREVHAALALTARLGRGALRTVERASKDACG